MRKILIVGDSPDMVATIKTTMRSGGHRTITTTKADEVAYLVDENAIDAMVLGALIPEIRSLALIKAIRARPRGRTVPILLLSALSNTENLVRALRVGADDYLVEPFEALELLARVERLISRHSPGTGLAGSLDSFTPAEVLQNLAHGQKTGRLELSAGLDMARVQIYRGDIVRARLDRLRGEDALLAILELDSGFFGFEPETGVGRGEQLEADTEDRLPLAKLLLEAAWLVDELRKRKADLPAPDHSLIAVAPPLDGQSKDFIDLPLEAVHYAIDHSPGIDRQDLVALSIASPSRVLLALAVMTEQGAIESRPDGAGNQSADDGVDRAEPLFRLVTACEQRGFGPEDTIHIMFLFQPEAWHQLLALVAAVAARQLTALRHQKLVKQLEDGRGGTVRLSRGGHQIRLHLRPLSEKNELQGEALMPIVAGVVLWLTEKTWSPDLTGFVVNVEAVASQSASVVLLPDRALLGRVRASLGALRHCSVTADAPGSFDDLALLLVDAHAPSSIRTLV